MGDIEPDMEAMMDDDEMQAAKEAWDDDDFIQQNTIQSKPLHNTGVQNQKLNMQTTSQAKPFQNQKPTVSMNRRSPEKRTNITININVSTSAEKKSRQRPSQDVQNTGRTLIKSNTSHGQQKLDSYFSKGSNKLPDNKVTLSQVPGKTVKRNLMLSNTSQSAESNLVSTVRVKREISPNPIDVSRGEGAANWNKPVHVKKESTAEIGKKTTNTMTNFIFKTA